MFGFIWQLCLLILGLIPLLIWWYVRNVKRRGGGVAFHTDLAFFQGLKSPRFAKRRDLPVVLFGLALALSMVAFARPTAPLPMLDNRTTIMLALDVSGSMRNTDIAPSRFVAAQEAARAFVRQLPGDLQLGLVTFAGSAAVNVSPGTDRKAVFDAIDSLYMFRGTAIGAGIRESLGVLPGRTLEPSKQKLDPNAPRAIIVLMTDGRNNREPDPLEMAEIAKQNGVPVYTIGLGTQSEANNSNPYAGFDPETLMSIARSTGGKYFEAKSAGQLEQVFRSLSSSLGWVMRPSEVTHLVAVLAGLLLLGSIVFGETNRRVI
jgi:Ca-activated chloride channel homolog